MTPEQDTLTPRAAIERLHQETALCSQMGANRRRTILTLAEHWIIELDQAEGLNEVTFLQVRGLVRAVNVALADNGPTKATQDERDISGTA